MKLRAQPPQVSGQKCLSFSVELKKKKRGAVPIENGKTIKKYIESRKKKRNHS